MALELDIPGVDAVCRVREDVAAPFRFRSVRIVRAHPLEGQVEGCHAADFRRVLEHDVFDSLDAADIFHRIRKGLERVALNGPVGDGPRRVAEVQSSVYDGQVVSLHVPIAGGAAEVCLVDVSHQQAGADDGCVVVLLNVNDSPAGRQGELNAADGMVGRRNPYMLHDRSLRVGGVRG